MEAEKFRPLIGVFGFVAVSTASITYFRSDYSIMSIGKTFMSMFFLTFGSFKLYNLEGFREAFMNYDPVAEKSSLYATLYPFLEVSIGLLYFLLLHVSFQMLAISVFSLTILLMVMNGSGVLHALREGRDLQCACLGNVFNVPMTWVTLTEDSLMALMAFWMLLSVI
ncbi:MAG: MauE/DoxX family redox-associated membrane protein [Candidatus Nanohaloarchaea archaeon]